MYTISVYENEFKDDLLNATQNVLKFKDELDNLSVIKNGFVTSDSVQKFIYFNDSKCFNSVVKPIILDGVIKSEYSSAGSGSACLNVLMYLVSRLIMQSKQDQIKFCNDLEKSIGNLSQFSKRFRHKDIKKVINNSFDIDIQKKIIKTIISNINVRSPVFLNTSKTRDTSIIFSDGFNFKLQVSSDALSPDKFWKHKNVNCLIIDGFIESVGEIHHVLERAAEDKQPYILFVRHLSDDVRSTIYYNRARETINVLPIEVGFDENTINVLNDISMCCDSDIISTYKGDTISRSIQDQIVKIDRVIATPLGVNIVNSPDSSKLNSHITYLRDRRDQSKNSEIYDLFDKRIRSLSSGKVTVNIGVDMLSKDRQSVERFDRFFRELRSLIQTDVIYVDDIKTVDSDIKKCFKRKHPYSLSAVSLSVLNAISIFKSITSIGHVLIEDKKI